ncbi:hypothetical protein D7D26_09350 [Pyramidobacter sp. CG50-2]|nr:hypothetical protein D7D26_09350 [Pyramidobacter sp. CG50-2]
MISVMKRLCNVFSQGTFHGERSRTSFRRQEQLSTPEVKQFSAPILVLYWKIELKGAAEELHKANRAARFAALPRRIWRAFVVQSSEKIKKTAEFYNTIF